MWCAGDASDWFLCSEGIAGSCGHRIPLALDLRAVEAAEALLVFNISLFGQNPVFGRKGGSIVGHCFVKQLEYTGNFANVNCLAEFFEKRPHANLIHLFRGDEASYPGV